MGTFSRIFGAGDKKLQKQADEMLLSLSKALQSASAKLCVCVKAWAKGDLDTVEEITKEVIELERESDKLKDDLITQIFSKHAYLPQQTEERYDLVTHLDSIIDAAEESVRLIELGKKKRPPKLIPEIAEKGWKCTDLLQDVVKFLFTDFEKAVEMTKEIENVREEARDLKFELHKRLFNDPECDPVDVIYFHSVSRRIIEVSIQAEETADFIRALAIRYS